MSALSFLNPAYLAALGLAAIPILIHLIRRRKVRIIPWAAWEFLLQSAKRNRRRLRIEQLLLLLVRILLICMVVLALCRPIIRATSLPLISMNARVHAVIALDNSMSMGHRGGGSSDFDRARRIADDVIARVLKQGDSVSVVLLSAQPEALLKEPTFDLARAREKLRTARLSDRGTDYAAGAAFCAQLLRNVRTPTRELYWITDSQKSGFPEATVARGRSAWKELAGLARCTWIDAAEPSRDNLAVDAPTFSRELVTPRTPVRIEAAIHNYGTAAKNGLLANLVVDGRTVGAVKVDVAANGTAKAQFIHLFERAGPHFGSVQLAQPDALARDDTAWFAVQVREKLSTLVVDGKPSTDPAQDEAFYYATALAPTGASGGGTAIIQPTLHAGPHLAGVNLRDFDAIVVTGFELLGDADRKALREYVASGGGAILFPGRDLDPARLNAAWGDALPARLGARRALSGDSAVSLNPASIDHPALATLRDTSEINLGSGKFSLVYELDPPAGDQAVRTICRFTGGQPAFVERRLGQGKLILSAAPAGSASGDLPFKAAYVPLVHQLTAYLAAGPASQHSLHLGEPINARFDVKEAGKPVRVTDPAGAVALRSSALTAQGVLFSYPETWQAGIYRVGTAAATAQAFAVNLPPAESDLATADFGQVQSYLGPARIQFAHGGDSLENVVRRARRGSEVWRTLIFIAICLALIESLLAQRFGRRG